MRALRIATLTALAGLATACSSPAQIPTAPSGTPAQSTPVTSPQASSDPSVASTSPAPSAEATSAAPSPSPTSHTFTVAEHETFDEPWAMTFLPGTDVLAVTERGGALKLRDASGVREVSGVPEVTVTEQGGLGDIIAGPTFEQDGTVYLSWVESGEGGTGAVVGTAKLDVDGAALSDVTKIWEQSPKIDGGGHYSHRLAIQGEYLFVSSGDRRQFTPAQEIDSTLGKILRLTLDGQPAADNPFQEDAPIAQQFWSVGHRNPLGLAFDADGRLWSSEMGPKGGDEVNLIKPGLNYGWPEASNGSNYDGSDIPDHTGDDGFEPPKVSWNPSVSPGSLMIYQGDLFPAWKGDAFIGALSGEALIRVNLAGDTAALADTWPMDARIREVEEGPDGAIWLLRDGDSAALLELRPE